MQWKPHSLCQQIWNTQQWPQDWKRSVFIPIPKKGNAKECSNYRTKLYSSANKCSKFSELGFNSVWTENFQVFKLDLEKVEESEIKLPTSIESYKKQENSIKNIYFFTDYAKAFDCVDHNKLWKTFRDENTRTPYLPPEKASCRSGITEADMNNRLVPSCKRSTSRLYIVTLLI